MGAKPKGGPQTQHSSYVNLNAIILTIKMNAKSFKRTKKFKYSEGDFPGGTVVKNPPANTGDRGSIPGPGGSHMPQSN